MSRIYYEFATRSQASWLQEISCDSCQVTLKRPGPLPKSEQDQLADFGEAGASELPLTRWAVFEIGASGDERFPRERLVRDLCPECAAVFNDMFAARGVDARGQERRYLDALGREAAGPWAPEKHREFCGVMRFAQGGFPEGPCMRLAGHEGEHSRALETGYQDCPSCNRLPQLLRPIRAYMLAELESHGLDEHDVHWEAAHGWWSAMESMSRNLAALVYYPNVVSALLAEANVWRTTTVRGTAMQIAVREATAAATGSPTRVQWLPPDEDDHS